MEPVSVTLLKDLNVNLVDYTIKVRILRLWSRPMFNNPRKVYCYDLIMQDDDGTKVQGFVLGKVCAAYEHLLKEKQCLVIRNPCLVENKVQKWKYVESGLKISFNEKTTVTSFNGSVGSEYGFHFSPFDSFVDSPDEDDGVPKVAVDVIGYVINTLPRNYKKATGNVKGENRITFQLKDLEGNVVHATMFDEYADQIVEFQNNNKDAKNVVIIIQFAKYKFFGGVLYFSNLYSVTRLFINTENEEIISFRKSFIENSVTEPSLTYSGLSSPIVVSLSDEYLSGSNFCTISAIGAIKERKFVIVLGTIKAFRDERSWYYNACKKCAKAVTTKTILKDKPDGSDGFDEVQVLECKDPNCNKDVVYSNPRIRLSVRVQDATGTVSLTLFEREMVKLLNVTASQLLDNNIELSNDGAMPEELKVLLNKKFAFKILVASGNLSNTYDSYSVSKLTDDPSILSELDKKFDVEKPFDEDSQAQALSNSSLMNTIPTKGSVSCTGDNRTPTSRMTNAMETPSLQDGELQSKMLKDNEFKRNLEKAFEGDEDCAMSATKAPKVYKPNEDSMAGNEGLLIPKTEKL